MKENEAFTIIVTAAVALMVFMIVTIFSWAVLSLGGVKDAVTTAIGIGIIMAGIVAGVVTIAINIFIRR
jgi:hypothetical protein